MLELVIAMIGTGVLVALYMDARHTSTRALVTLRETRILELEEQVRYFRTRMERLNDAALARKGEIHQPTMTEPNIPKRDLGALIASAVSITEIDSST
jgi:hypothetical protein